jgi:hypothetical protein
MFNGLPWGTVTHDRGHRCGECGRFLKHYNRCLSTGLARTLVELYMMTKRMPHKAPFHVSMFDTSAGRGEVSKLMWWGFVKEEANNDSAKRRSGFWSINDFGKDFVLNIELVPQYAIEKWDTGSGPEILGFAGPAVSIKDCLEYRNRFDYQSLMATV